MSLKFNPITGKLDIAGLSASGGNVTGDITFPVTGYLMTDSDGKLWRITIGTDGSLIIQSATVPTTGQPETGQIHPWFWLFTYTI